MKAVRFLLRGREFKSDFFRKNYIFFLYIKYTIEKSIIIAEIKNYSQWRTLCKIFPSGRTYLFSNVCLYSLSKRGPL